MIHLTIFTDASYCRWTKAGGWGVWAKGYRMDPIEGGGSLPVTANSVAAEICAIRYGINHVRRFITTRGLNVLIQSDSTVALASILKLLPTTAIEHQPGDHPIARPRQQRAVQRWREVYEADARRLAGAIKSCHFESVTIRHVRAHREDGARSEANNRCDALARAGMEVAREALRALAAKGAAPGAPNPEMPVSAQDS